MTSFALLLNEHLSRIPGGLSCRAATLDDREADDVGRLRALMTAEVEESLAGAPAEVRGLMAGLRLDQWRSSLPRRRPGATIVLLAERDEVVGAMILDLTGTGPILMLDATIHPSHRNRGLGGKVLGCLCALTDEGGRWLNATLMYDNPCRRLLARHGFRKINDTDMEVVWERPANP